ncbi:FkbM family methyltransferase [Mucilaginibacter agri]|uniref:FkbM family methyltransferase n=1 Tax=Mucilaginibacter agri TaxID=2695265 RepID=A0A966DUG1_9SPHI|nr:FkbM family methyltransferase [Mucilaginibacter agri]NCD70406.1 FkbM family methyltransferase [Mucilaginibacter agri]
MKKKIILTLQKLLGYENYLYYFSRFKAFLLKHDKYEQGFLQFLDLIPQGTTLLDIGANIGITSVPMAKKFPSLTLHSFEPVPPNISALKRVIKHFKLKNVVLHEIGLADAPGELKMVIPIINGVKMQGLCHMYNEATDSPDEGEIITVPVKKLDDLDYLQSAEKIAGIKIDVENFEYYVLKGGQQLLTRHKPVIYCELWDNEMRPLVMNYLKELGYAVKVFENKALVDFKDQEETNFIFISQ